MELYVKLAFMIFALGFFMKSMNDLSHKQDRKAEREWQHSFIDRTAFGYDPDRKNRKFHLPRHSK